MTIATTVMPAIVGSASTTRLSGTASGPTRPETPATANRLKTLLPMMLPAAISTRPRRAASSVTATSGSEVPIATAVAAMVSVGMAKRTAISTTARTVPSAPSQITAPLTTSSTTARATRTAAGRGPSPPGTGRASAS